MTIHEMVVEDDQLAIVLNKDEQKLIINALQAYQLEAINHQSKKHLSETARKAWDKEETQARRMLSRIKHITTDEEI